MDREDHARLREIDDETFGGMRTDYDDETYEVLREWFAREPLEELLASVERTHDAIWQSFLIELQWAAGLLYKSLDQNARLAGYLRAYRAIESYRHSLTEAIVTSYTRPFLPVHEGQAIRARSFFHPRALDVIRDQVFDRVFRTTDVRTSLAAFFDDNKDARNRIVHGLKVPSHGEFRALVVAA